MIWGELCVEAVPHFMVKYARTNSLCRFVVTQPDVTVTVSFPVKVGQELFKVTGHVDANLSNTEDSFEMEMLDMSLQIASFSRAL